MNSMREWEYAIRPEFDWACHFSEGMAAISISDDMYGFIDTSGAIRIKPMFEGLGSDVFGAFSDGLVCVNDGDKFGYIDKAGEYVLRPIYEYGSDFSDGVASVGSWPSTWWYIDKTGKPITKQTYYNARKFCDGLAFVQPEKKSKWGYINKDGAFVIKPDFDECEEGDFSEGMAVARKAGYGFIDQKGEWVIKPIYQCARRYSQGFAAVCIDGKWGFIDKSGEIKIVPQYYMVETFSEGLAPFAVDLLADRSDPDFEDDPDILQQGPAPIDGTKWGYINTSGEVIIEPIFDQAESFFQGLAAVKVDNCWGYIRVK